MTATDPITRRQSNVTAIVERFGIWTLLLIVVLIRLPFWPGVRALRDGIAYSIGALVTHVAHPPGSAGYCLLGGWLNHLVGNVESTFIYINLIAGVVGTYFCYRLALTARLSLIAALLAAAMYGLSINTLTAALTIAPHLVEGVGTILAAWLGLLAVQRKHRGFAIGCTLTVALIGSFRPTATAFLIPMWLYSIYQSETLPIRRRLPMLMLHAALFIVIAATWNYANNYYMTRAGYGGTTYEKQVLTVAPYDYVSMSTDVQATASHHTFHLPAAEMLAWLELRLHVRLLPHIPDWPTPSLSRALKLSVQQAVKQATFLIVSVPAVVLVALLCLWERITSLRMLRWNSLDCRTWILLICWITPAGLFFIFGHLGTLTYLQNYLGAICLVCAAVLGPVAEVRKMGVTKSANGADDILEIGVTKPTDTVALLRETGETKSPIVHRENPGKKQPPWLTIGPATICALGGAAIFAFGRPLPVSHGPLNLINVSLLQYSGPSKAMGYGASRINAVLANATPAQSSVDEDYLNANSDQALIATAIKDHFEYLNPDKSKPSSFGISP